jgi:hypothetical protein
VEKKKEKKPAKKRERLTLAPLKFEDALRAMLDTKPTKRN